jgi:polyisoprenoid-binding protein YceI
MIKLSLPKSGTLGAAVLFVMAVVAASCSPAPATNPPAPTATTAPEAVSTQAPPTALPGDASTPTSAPEVAGQLRLVITSDGNEARFRVNELLAGRQLPGDAVGSTNSISGAIVMGADGVIVSDASKFVVDLKTLATDSSMRDGFIQRNTLETGRFPTAEFVPTQALGLPSPLPVSGDVAFQLVGDLTLHGVTQSTTWDVTAQIVDGRALVGTATTSFKFGDFGMTIPQVARVLSIEDNIRLEYDFHMQVEP